MYNYIDFSQFSADEILVYLRKSRSDDPLLSVEEVLARHEAILDEWAEKYLGEKIPEENKFREIVSGETIADRPVMQVILKKIESPKIKAVLIVEVQRLSRGDLEDAGRIIKLFRFTNTLVITPPKAYDLSDEYDRDAFERELKRGNEFLEYTKKIMQRGTMLSVASGNYLGSHPPYGYEKVWITEGKRKVPTLSIKEDEANVVRMIYDMYVNKNILPTTIARTLDSLHISPARAKHWSQASIKEILSNEHYLGKIRWNVRKAVSFVEDSEIIKKRHRVKEYLLFDGKHEAIISEELFKAAQEKQGKNHRAKPTTKVRNPFASILYCHCGRAMSYKKYKEVSPRLTCEDQVHCHTGSCTYDELVVAVSDILKQSITDFEIHIKNDDGSSVKLHEKLIKSLEKKLNELDAKELSQWEAQSDPNPANRMPQHIFRQLNEKLQKERAEVHEALCKAYESMPEAINYVERLATFREALDALNNPDIDAANKNRLLKDCIERIEYSRERPQRVESQQVLYYDKERKRTRWKSPLNTGGNWSKPPITIEVKLKV